MEGYPELQDGFKAFLPKEEGKNEGGESAEQKGGEDTIEDREKYGREFDCKYDRRKEG